MTVFPLWQPAIVEFV